MTPTPTIIPQSQGFTTSNNDRETDRLNRLIDDQTGSRNDEQILKKRQMIKVVN
jgi:hypothetical protein